MTPGTRPAARSLRATPLPVSERGSALRVADAMIRILRGTVFDCSEPRCRCYSQAAASALPCRGCEAAYRGDKQCNGSIGLSVYRSIDLSVYRQTSVKQ